MPELVCAAGSRAPSGDLACVPAARLAPILKVNICLIMAAGCLCLTYTAGTPIVQLEGSELMCTDYDVYSLPCQCRQQ